MAKYELSKLADHDLKVVYLYSARHFGTDQADTYIAGLLQCIELISEQPRMGQLRVGKDETKRVFFYRSHVIAYRIKEKAILVQRLLDTRRNWQRILNG